MEIRNRAYLGNQLLVDGEYTIQMKSKCRLRRDGQISCVTNEMRFSNLFVTFFTFRRTNLSSC